MIVLSCVCKTKNAKKANIFFSFFKFLVTCFIFPIRKVLALGLRKISSSDPHLLHPRLQKQTPSCDSYRVCSLIGKINISPWLGLAGLGMPAKWKIFTLKQKALSISHSPLIPPSWREQTTCEPCNEAQVKNV